MDKQRIKEILLAHGYKERLQPDGTMDLNPYAYTAAQAIILEALNLQKGLDVSN